MDRNNTKSFFAGRKLVLFQDLTLSVAASLLSILMVRWLSEPMPQFSTRVLIWIVFAVAGTILGALATHLWKLDVRYLNLTSIGRIGGAVVVKEVFMALSLVTGLVDLPSLVICFLTMAVDTLLSAFLILAPRYLMTSLHMEERSLNKSLARQTALVMGTEDESVALARKAEASGRYQVVGYLTSDRAKEGRVIDTRIVYYFEDKDDLLALQWRLGGIDCILFPMDWNSGGQPGGGKKSKDIPVDSTQMTLAGYVMKRGFDIGLSGILLLIFAPLMGICALAVHWQDGGPAIFKQERIGKGGKPFNILKFRSMRIDAEKDNSPMLFGGDNDSRLTPVGKFLRLHHLDELPQLWNVFRGDMSFIGYRPERQFYISQIMERNPRYKYLYLIRPGVTSYATLYNGYTDTLEKMLTRLDLDLYYLRNHSVMFDLKVLGLTFLRIVTGRKF